MKQVVELQCKTILVTGATGFIGSHLVLNLLKNNSYVNIIGIDNMNDYYDVSLKEYRLKQLEAEAAKHCKSSWAFIKGSIADRDLINYVFRTYKPSIVVNLAA